MKGYRFFCGLLLLVLLVAGAPLAGAAESGGHDDHGEHDVIGGPNAGLWKTVNFLALIGIGAYMLRGKVAPFFEERNRSIASGMSDAATREQEAARRLQAVEEKLSGLQAEIAQLREVAQVEMERDRQRVEAETAQALARIQEHTSREIATAGAVARTQLRHYAAELAMQLAEQQVRTRAAEPGMQEALIAQAIRRLPGQAEATRN